MAISAAKVKQLRQQRGWSQEHLASVAGLSARTVQRLEADGRGSGETGMAIAAAFELHLDQLTEDPPAPTPAGSDLLTILLTLFIVIMLMLAGGYQVGKDLAVRDNARASSGR